MWSISDWRDDKVIFAYWTAWIFLNPFNKPILLLTVYQCSDQVLNFIGWRLHWRRSCCVLTTWILSALSSGAFIMNQSLLTSTRQLGLKWWKQVCWMSWGKLYMCLELCFVKVIFLWRTIQPWRVEQNSCCGSNMEIMKRTFQPNSRYLNTRVPVKSLKHVCL